MPEPYADDRAELRADCSRCVGLCCVAPAFAASADFALDKPAGTPCPHLADDSRCGIHADLRGRASRGARSSTASAPASTSCRRRSPAATGTRRRPPPRRCSPSSRWCGSSRSCFGTSRKRRSLLPPGPLRDEVDGVREQTEALLGRPADELRRLDTTAHRQQAGRLLERVSEAVRVDVVDRAPDRRGADLMGLGLRAADRGPRTADRQRARCLPHRRDLRGADLRQADLLGADLRGADLCGARLDSSLFLTQPQLDAAGGDAATRLPMAPARPRHWPTTAAPVRARGRRR